jgi:hypothetical protein
MIVGLLAGAFGVCLFGSPQDQSPNPSLEQQLNAQYPVARVGTNGVLIQTGAVLTIQEDGIKTIPASYQAYLANNVKKGGRIKMNIVQHVGGGGPGVYLNDSRLLQVGEKVYLTKLEVKATEIVFSVQSCGSCNPAAVDPDQTPFRSSLAFQFAKGYLATADFKDVLATIREVFAVDSAPAIPPSATVAAPQSTPDHTLAPAVQQAEPLTITLGQAKDQVVSAMGQPDRVAKVGNKEICFFKDLKITFVDGKVSDIQ